MSCLAWSLRIDKTRPKLCLANLPDWARLAVFGSTCAALLGMMKRSLISAAAILLAGAVSAQGILSGPSDPNEIGFGGYQSGRTDSRAVTDAWIRSYMKRRDDEKKKSLKNKQSMYDSIDGDDSRLSEVRKRFVPPAKAVPEPGTMIALGAAAAVFLARKRKKTS